MYSEVIFAFLGVCLGAALVQLALWRRRINRKKGPRKE